MTTAPTRPGDITDHVVERLRATPDPRLREVVSALVRHLHAFAEEVHLTEAEWARGIRFLTETGDITSPERQEFVLLSDTLGLSMLVDALNHGEGGGVTESTVLGPFYVPGSPERAYGDSTAERPSGDPAWVTGTVTDTDGAPIPGAELDVWQNGDDMLYAVQDPDAPTTNLRGLFRAREDGTYAFLGVRPVDYPIPHDGPVGKLLESTGRHPWRAAHLHVIVRAPGFQSVTTHIFDDGSRYLDSDAVFGVKPSLIRHFTPHEPGDAGRPAGVTADERWYSLDYDFVLRRA